jgi:hypothetical protein
MLDHCHKVSDPNDLCVAGDEIELLLTIHVDSLMIYEITRSDVFV